MFKRIRWMGIGALAGAGASLWAEAKMRRSLEAHPSVEIGARAARGLKNLGGELRDAVVDGREAMAAREAALRNQVGARFAAGAGTPPEGARLRLVTDHPTGDPHTGATGDPAVIGDRATNGARAATGDPASTGDPADEPGGDDPHRPPTGGHPAGRSRRRLRSS